MRGGERRGGEEGGGGGGEEGKTYIMFTVGDLVAKRSHTNGYNRETLCHVTALVQMLEA